MHLLEQGRGLKGSVAVQAAVRAYNYYIHKTTGAQPLELMRHWQRSEGERTEEDLQRAREWVRKEKLTTKGREGYRRKSDLAVLRTLKERAVEEWGATEVSDKIRRQLRDGAQRSLEAEWTAVERKRPSRNHRHNRR
ncbi:hypothetical protein AAG570_010814 [Ranatra chinensis]|uniref:Uncharacterized protein n=1 Tax=Ranatra chinensis TaxID=642074 RepID=A0ABD0YJ34_9HEMI